jgi:plasmid stabilization system protein ParE
MAAIQLPEEIQSVVDAEVRERGFSSASEYLARLGVRRARRDDRRFVARTPPRTAPPSRHRLVPPRPARTAKAARDIQREWVYLFENGGPDVADRFLEALERTTELLGQTPFVGTLRTSARKQPKEYRRFPVHLPFGTWLILYLPTVKGITVIAVVHGKRHPDNLHP